MQAETAIDLDLIKGNILGVVSQYLPLKKRGRYYVACCPFHQEKTPSFTIFEDTQSWYCFGACACGGDVIEFVRKIENTDFNGAVQRLSGGGFASSYAPAPRQEQDDKPSEFDTVTDAKILDWHRGLLVNTDAMSYLKGRGIIKEYIRWRFLGWDGQAITIPWQDAFGNFVGVKLKRPGKSGYYAISGSHFAPDLYGFEAIRRGRGGLDRIILVETELDSLLVNGLLGNSLAVAKPANAIKAYHMHIFDRVRRINIIPDNDEAGRKSAYDLRRMIPRARVYTVPETYKDIGEYWQAEKRNCREWLKDIINTEPAVLTGDDLTDFACVELGAIVKEF